MISTPINLSKFYELSFRGAKALINQISWNNVPSQNKLRKFFLRDNWQNDIIQISVSSSGAKGGVFFLEVDTLDRQQLNAEIGNVVKAGQIWDQLVKDGLITSQGIKLPAAKSTTLVLRNLVYTNNVTKIRNLLTPANPKRQFVVKGTEEPGRTLFAEYILNRVGKAKIPKSLVLEVDPTRPYNHPTNPSEGMVMLHLLSDPTKRNPHVDAQRYLNSYAFLDDGQGTQTSRVKYLVVQKLVTGSTLPIKNDVSAEIVDFLIEEKIIITEDSFLADVGFQGTSTKDAADLIVELRQKGCISGGGIVDAQYQQKIVGLAKLNNKLVDITRILQASSDILVANGLQFTKNSIDGQFDELDAVLQQAGDSPFKQRFLTLRAQQAAAIKEIEAILGTPEAMINAGRVIFADLAIGNGDRFENMNSGNFFFVNKVTNALGKVNYPIGCIDNDAFLHTFLPRRNAPVPEGFATLDDYIDGLLVDGRPELWAKISAPPPNFNPGPSAMVLQMMDVGKWFDKMFFTIFIVGMPKCVVKHFSANFYDPTDTYPYKKSIQLPGWQTAKQYMQEGFCTALLEYQGVPLHEFRQVYITLANEYGNGPNFDFVAFEVRDLFLRAAQVDQKNWTVILPDFDTIKGIIFSDLKRKIGGSGFSRLIQKALASDEGIKVLKQANITQDQVTRLLAALSISDQEALIPNPLGEYTDKHKRPIHFGALPEDYKKYVIEKWEKLDEPYKVRMNAVICAILVRFVTDYEAETSALPAYVFVIQSQAYRNALQHAWSFTYAKLYKNGKNQKNNRRMCFAEFQLKDYLTE